MSTLYTNTEGMSTCSEEDEHASTLSSLSPSSTDDLGCDDAEERLAKSRERNREHARRTRLRKKAQLQALQSRVKELEVENTKLRQSVEECSIAAILLRMSAGEQAKPTCAVEKTESTATTLPPKKRHRAVSTSGDLTIKINGIETVIGGNGKTHINWKNGVYSDENGEQKQLTSEELETLRRERNRMHAKMTRDRKKKFLSNVKQTIEQLEEENAKLREKLLEASKNKRFCGTKTSPDLSSQGSVLALHLHVQ